MLDASTVSSNTTARRTRPLTPSWLLQRDTGERSRGVIASAAMAALRALAACDAAIDLCVGAALRRLTGELGGVKPLGHSNLDDFARARLGISWSAAKQLRQMSERLEALPLLRAAFLAGDLSGAKLRVVLRAATAETEGGWLVLAKRSGTRRLEEVVQAFRRGAGQGGGAELDAEADAASRSDEGVRVGWSASDLDVAMFRGWGRAMVRDVVHHRVSDAVVAEAIASEALTAFGGADEAPGGCVSVVVTRRRGQEATRPAEGARPVTPSRLAALARGARRAVRGRPAGFALPDVTAPRDAWEMLELLGDLMAERHGLEAERSSLLGLVYGRSLHHELSFRRFDDFLQHGLGISPREAAQLMTIDHELTLLRRTQQAWQEGCVSRQTASLLARVADASTEAVWLLEAGRVSLKRLEIEVAWHQVLIATSALGEYDDLVMGLPTWLATRQLLLDWREMFGCRERLRGIEAAGILRASEESPEFQKKREAAPPPRTRRATEPPAHEPSQRRGRISFACPPDVADLIGRAVGCVSDHLGGADVASCIHWMLLHFASVHAAPEHELDALQHPIPERDGWTCTMPQCTQTRVLHVHHVHERARGGPLEAWNETTLCEGCHLGLIHANHARTFGHAPDDITTVVLGGRETWRDERLIARAPRTTAPWSARCAAAADAAAHVDAVVDASAAAGAPASAGD